MPQLQKAIFDLVIAKRDGSEKNGAFHNLRGCQSLKHILGNPSADDKRKTIESIETNWNDSLDTAAFRGPLSTKYLSLKMKEMGLIGDILVELEALDLDHPKDLRDTMDLVQSLANQPNEYKLKEAVALLNLSAFNDAYYELYPKADDDDDDVSDKATD
jgi:hypothetical protein